MHDETTEGNQYFKCDFCLSPWAEDRQMVEGHRGSLICSSCLTLSYRMVHVAKQGEPLPAEPITLTCSLCIERHETRKYWQSPLRPEAYACDRCINQSARILQKDPESGWKIPTA